MRPRTVLYAAIIAIVGGVMLYTLATRDSEGINVIHDRNPIFVRLSDGALRNAYTMRIVNKQLKTPRLLDRRRRSAVVADRLRRLPPRADGRQLVAVGPDQTREVRVLVTDYSATPPAPSTPVLFKLTDVADRRGRRNARPFLRAVNGGRTP